MYSKKIVKTSFILLLLVLVTSGMKLVLATTWSVNVNRFTDYTYYDGFPVITQMRDGKLWLVWSKEILGNLTLYYKNSSNLGRTWSDAKNLTLTPAQGHDQNPSIIQAENGTIWIAWASSRSSPFEPPPGADYYLNATPASLTIPQGGTDNSTISITSINNFTDTLNLYASYISGVTSVLDPEQVFLPPNETVNSTLTVTVNSTATPGNYTLTVMAEPQNSRIINGVDIPLEITDSTTSSSNLLSFTLNSPKSTSSPSASLEDYEIFIKTSHDNGATWSKALQLTNDVYDDLHPSIVQLTNGTIMLVWQSNRLGNHDIFFMTTTDGTLWSDPTQLTTDPDPDRGPHSTQTMDDKIWIAWTSKRTGDYEIFYKTYNGSWSNDTRLTYGTNSDSTPWILQTIDGTIMIFYSSGTETIAYDVYYMYSSDNGATWSPSIQFTTDDYEDMWPSATQINDITIWVVWTSNRGDQTDGNWDVYYKTSLAGDINEDGIVDISDISLVSFAYGTFIGETFYNPDADLNKDGVVDLTDLSIVAIHYGET